MVGAETMWLPQIGAQTSTNVYERHADTQYSDTIHTTRKLTSNAETQADLIDIPDQKRSVAQFLGPYAENFAQLFGRRKDEIILDAAIGTNYYKVNGSTTETPIPLPATQQVANDFSVPSTDEGLSLAKLIEAKSILGKNETPMGEMLYFVYRQEQLDDLLKNVDQVSNADYANIKALIDSEVGYFAGFNFIKTQLVSVASDVASCVAYTKSALVAGVTSGFTARVEQLPQKNYSWQVWASLDMGATRMQEEGVVEVLCDQAP